MAGGRYDPGVTEPVEAGRRGRFALVVELDRGGS